METFVDATEKIIGFSIKKKKSWCPNTDIQVNELQLAMVNYT